MMSQTSAYALRALNYIVNQGSDKLSLCREIAEETKVPSRYLSKILQTLARQKVLVSVKGYGGGFRLARPSDQISLFDVIEPLESFERVSNCILGNAECSDATACSLHRRWGSLTDHYMEFLKTTTLKDLGEAENQELLKNIQE